LKELKTKAAIETADLIKSQSSGLGECLFRLSERAQFDKVDETLSCGLTESGSAFDLVSNSGASEVALRFPLT
jgi:hypothetical protein